MQSFHKILVACLFLFFIACSSPHSKQASKIAISVEEYAWMEKFLRYFMLHETAIYTLAGSKPLTEIPLFYEEVPEEQRREEDREERLYFLLNRNNPRDLEFYEKLSSKEKKEKAYLIPDRDFIYSFEDLWDKWEKIQDRFPIKKRFLLVKKEWLSQNWKAIFPNCKAIYSVFFVDVLKTALVIQENYDLFRQAVGYDFDPLEIVFELENEHSPFWDLLRGEESWQYTTLWGLLYGFGKENAFSYTWKGRHAKESSRTEQEKCWAARLTPLTSCQNVPVVTDKNAFSILNFTIPIFKSFVENDPVIAKYEAERTKIQQLYQGKDFVTFTLELFTELPSQNDAIQYENG